MAERRQLLEDSGLLFTDPLLEPVLPYDATVPLAGVCQQAGISPRTGEIVGRALFGAFTPPWQPRACCAPTRPRRSCALSSPGRRTAGTSSSPPGRARERPRASCLPVLLRLVEESASWTRQPQAHRWWMAAAGVWQPSRGSETRPAAVRALVLYPTNALVEDQMIRLRRGVRRIAAADEQSKLWFGRYTGSTLGRCCHAGVGKDPESRRSRRSAIGDGEGA